MRLAFAGTPAAAVPSLQALLDSPDHDVVAVVTRPAAAAGRGRSVAVSPVERLAREVGIAVLDPVRPSDPGFLQTLAGLGIDCCPVVAYGALLPRAALSIPSHGWVNLHFSLLPAWRGAAPVQHALLHGDDITGASTFRIEEGLDTGPVFGVVTEPIGSRDTAGDLLARLSVSGATLLLATLDGIESGTLTPVPQPTDGVSLAPKVNVADAAITWASPALHVDRLIRACTPEPGAWTTFRGARLKVGPVELPGRAESERAGPGTGAEAPLAPGQLRVTRAGVRVGTATADVVLGDVQPEGKRGMRALDWARGARPDAGEYLG